MLRVVLALSLASGILLTGRPAANAPGKLVLVKMVDVSATEYRFEPADLAVSPDDTLRFEQAGAMPHNVEFREVPAGTSLGDARSGPYLTAPGQRYDLVIDGRFAAGAHKFVCTPHESLGMRGTLTVAGR